MLESLDKKAIEQNPVKELKRLMDLLISREAPHTYEKRKWIKLRDIIIPFMRIHKMTRETVKNIMLEMDIEKIKLDESDWYFCLRRKCYNYRGVTIEDRLKEAERIDKEKGHQFLVFEYLNDPRKKVGTAIKTDEKVPTEQKV